MRLKSIDGAWDFYNNWRKENSFSPALKKNVKITRKGWSHIFNKNRNETDKYRRLKLLPYAKELIELSTTIQNIKQSDETTFIAIEHVFNLETNYKVRVILESKNNSDYTFLSVMDKKI